ncbi:MAG: sulfite exporter TauE/SafE family protein [Burkholderiaceae bacterium]
MTALYAIALCVGVLIGAVGVGGILLIPAINAFAALPLQASMATALATFIFTGIAGTWLFQRRGSIDWSQTIPLCVGGALFGFAGAWANGLIDAHLLGFVLAVLTVLAGFYTLLTRASPLTADAGRPTRPRRTLLFVIGALTGFGSGLTGVGGPALSVPMMVLFGFPLLPTIGSSQVIQVVAALSGSIGNLAYGHIDFHLVALLTVFEVVGVSIGVKLAHAVDARYLRRAVGVLCIAVGVALGVRFVTERFPSLDGNRPVDTHQPPAKAVRVPVINCVSCFITT